MSVRLPELNFCAQSVMSPKRLILRQNEPFVADFRRIYAKFRESLSGSQSCLGCQLEGYDDDLTAVSLSVLGYI